MCFGRSHGSLLTGHRLCCRAKVTPQQALCAHDSATLASSSATLCSPGVLFAQQILDGRACREQPITFVELAARNAQNVPADARIEIALCLRNYQNTRCAHLFSARYFRLSGQTFVDRPIVDRRRSLLSSLFLRCYRKKVSARGDWCLAECGCRCCCLRCYCRTAINCARQSLR